MIQHLTITWDQKCSQIKGSKGHKATHCLRNLKRHKSEPNRFVVEAFLLVYNTVSFWRFFPPSFLHLKLFLKLLGKVSLLSNIRCIVPNFSGKLVLPKQRAKACLPSDLVKDYYPLLCLLIILVMTYFNRSCNRRGR